MINRWNRQFEEHPIHTTLSEIESFIDIELDNIDANEVTEKRRILKVLSVISELLKNIDAEIIPFIALDSFNNGLMSHDCYQNLKAYGENGTVDHLVTANNFITTLLPQLTQYMILSDKFSVNKDIKVLEASFDEFTSILTTEKDKLEVDIDELSKLLENNKATFTQLSSTIDIKKQETDNLITQWQQQFSDAQDGRSTNYNELVEKLKNDTNDSIQSHISENKTILDNNNKKFSDSVSKYLDDSKKKHQEILDLYHLTAGDSVASAYIANADYEKMQADVWRWFSVGFIIATAIWICVAFFLDSNAWIDETSKVIIWPKLVMSFSLTSVLLFGAAYSAQQSNKHRNNEKKTRWFALEVKAIDPFIASLDVATKQDLKKKLSEKLFAQSDQSDDLGGTNIDVNTYKTFVNGIVDILKAKT